MTTTFSDILVDAISLLIVKTMLVVEGAYVLCTAYTKLNRLSSTINGLTQ